MNQNIERFYAQFPEKGPPEIYYDSSARCFVYHQSAGDSTRRQWIHVSKADAAALLDTAGISNALEKGESTTLAEKFLLNLMNDPKTTVQFSGALGGYHKGVHHLANGVSVLITSGPTIPKAVRGDCEDTIKIVDSLFGPGPAKYMHAYAKLSVTMLTHGILRGLPVPIMVGPKNCGKTFYQDFILTPLLGGRSSDGNKYLTGKTHEPFNKELCSVEHIVFSDPTLSPRMSDRRDVGGKLKEIVANNNVQYRRMYLDALTLPIFRRATLSVNNETEIINTLPPLDDDLYDKVMLFRVSMVTWPTVCETVEERELYKRKIEAQASAYRWWLENEFVIPHEITRDPKTGGPARFCLSYWHDPILKVQLLEMSPEFKLIELIRSCFFAPDDPVKTLTMSALDIETGLMSPDSPTRSQALSLLSHGSRIATYLKRLARDFPDQISQSRSSVKRQWVITDIDGLIDKVASGAPGRYA